MRSPRLPQLITAKTIVFLVYSSFNLLTFGAISTLMERNEGLMFVTGLSYLALVINLLFCWLGYSMVDYDPPADLARLKLPFAVDARLQFLLDRQNSGQPLTPNEHAEAEGLADLADLLSLLRLRAERGAA